MPAADQTAGLATEMAGRLALLTVKEVARILRVSERSVRSWLAAGTLAYVKLGGGRTAPVRIRAEEVDRFLVDGGAPPPTPAATRQKGTKI